MAFSSLPEIQSLVDESVVESTSLEFKAAAALDASGARNGEIATDASAFANAGEGTIIYGLSERRVAAPGDGATVSADSLDPVVGAITTDQLSDIIRSNTEPPLSNTRLSAWPFRLGVE